MGLCVGGICVCGGGYKWNGTLCQGNSVTLMTLIIQVMIYHRLEIFKLIKLDQANIGGNCLGFKSQF